MRIPRLLALSVLLAVVSAAAVAQAKAPSRVARDPDLWATINICDTERHENTIGIRGSMPGNRRKGAMDMRFRLQYYSRSEGRWHNIASGGDSRWIRVGSSRKPVREAGWNFRVNPPAEGDAFVLRGKVLFRWRNSKRKVVATATRITKQRRGRITGADPRGFSASLCELR